MGHRFWAIAAAIYVFCGRSGLYNGFTSLGCVQNCVCAYAMQLLCPAAAVCSLMSRDAGREATRSASDCGLQQPNQDLHRACYSAAAAGLQLAAASRVADCPASGSSRRPRKYFSHKPWLCMLHHAACLLHSASWLRLLCLRANQRALDASRLATVGLAKQAKRLSCSSLKAPLLIPFGFASPFYAHRF